MYILLVTMKKMSCAVLGAGGGTGLECVKQLLSSDSHSSVVAVVRDPAKYEGVFPQVCPFGLRHSEQRLIL